MTQSALGEEIDRLYRRELCRPFPTRDVARLRKVERRRWDELHGSLDVWFGDVAGYACGAHRLRRRPRTELREAREFLSQSFFEWYPSLAVYRDAITEESTPALLRCLAIYEEVRKKLLVLLDEILAEEDRV